MLSRTTRSVEETEHLAETLGRCLSGGLVLGLTGPLGAGKTCFVRGLAKGLRTETDYAVTSPTFTLANVYKGPLPLFHFDLYRLSDMREWETLGFDDYLKQNGVCVVEWFDKFDTLVPVDLMIAFQQISPEQRTITVLPLTQQGGAVCREFLCGQFGELSSDGETHA